MKPIKYASMQIAMHVFLYKLLKCRHLKDIGTCWWLGRQNNYVLMLLPRSIFYTEYYACKVWCMWLKHFLAGTYSNQFLYLNGISESERRKIPKIMVSQRMEYIFCQKFHFQSLLWFTTIFEWKLPPFTCSCQYNIVPSKILCC